MPQVVRAQVIMNPASTPKEQIMNTWHCVTVGATTPLAAVTAFATALDTFYQGIQGNFSADLEGAQPLARCFDLNDPMPRQPILEDEFSSLDTGSQYGVREIACCLSYKGTYLSGVSPKRKRGRIYIGPLSIALINTSTGMFTSAFRLALVSAADTLLAASDGSSLFRWVVYSPTSDPNSGNPAGGAGTDADCWDAVTEGWVDEDPDIQRRRSRPGGTRSTFT